MHEQEALLRQTELLKETQSLARVGSFEWDIRSNELRWSEILYDIFGVAPENFSPTLDAYLQFVHPDDVQQVKECIQSAVSTVGSFEVRERIVRRDQSLRVLYTRGRVICDANGLPDRLIGACMDVTEQSLTIDQLHASEARYRALVDHASDSLVL
ncbi:MAG: PAS domain-containing protein, partial [Pirellulaceae bacterium]|nr:PAS domain-containing protein [Pirellulaceae bacterium]